MRGYDGAGRVRMERLRLTVIVNVHLLAFCIEEMLFSTSASGHDR